MATADRPFKMMECSLLRRKQRVLDATNSKRRARKELPHGVQTDLTCMVNAGRHATVVRCSTGTWGVPLKTANYLLGTA
jgi:hypothetical protein